MVGGGLAVAMTASAGGPARAETYACDSIHAVQIARQEGLGNCNVTKMDTRGSGEASGGDAPFADPSWQLDCVGLTANQCADRHYRQPERTVRSNQGEMKLHFLESQERCADGTRPSYYYAAGSEEGARRWLVFLNGSSGSCSARLERATGKVSALGQTCYESFETRRAQGSFLSKRAKNADGILSSSGANPYANWNRVHIPSCSNDQYQGARLHGGVPVVKAGTDEYTANVYSQGQAIVKSIISELARKHGLNQSELTVFNGSSGGAEGLIMTLDALTGHTRTLLQAQPDAPIVALIDSRGAEPGLDNSEARFDDATLTCGSIFRADCTGKGFDGPPHGTDVAGFSFDESGYLPHSQQHPSWGAVSVRIDSWGAALDEECQTVHGARAPECLDPNHVLFNHLRTPVFVAASISDSNQWDKDIEMAGEQQRDTTWQQLDCGPQRAQNYMQHTRHQLVSFARDRDNRYGGADGESNGSALVGVWAPRIWDHVLAHDACKFNRLKVGGLTLAEAFGRWLGGNPVTLIDGYRGATTVNPCGGGGPVCP
jgi:hypothetical protein